MNAPLRYQIEQIVRNALAEDLPHGDVTTRILFREPLRARATILAHQEIVIAGLPVAREVFAQIDPAVRVVSAKADGDAIAAGQSLLTLEGDARSLLIGERVALNFLQRLCGIATMTRDFCEAVRGYRASIVDTRKTTPGLRVLEKWAVVVGGGKNHRHSLSDGILIKDNHLALVKAQGQSVAQALERAREAAPHGLRIIVEAASTAQVREALAAKAEVILLDNMTPSEVADAVGLIKGRAVVEVSGGITLETARDLAAAGADLLSIGALTHSAPAANLSMDLVPRARRTRRVSR